MLARIGNPFPVRGNAGKQFIPGVAGQLTGRSAFPGHRIEVARVGKYHLIAMNGRETQETCFPVLGLSSRKEEGCESP